MKSILWSAAEISVALGVQLKALDNNYRVVIDSRRVQKGDIFIALQGNKYNGSLFLEEAFRLGAVLCIVDDNSNIEMVNKLLVVKNSGEALIKLALYRRRTLSGSIIGITGSTGKSTTKEFFQSVLSVYGKSYASPGNYNSKIGLPLALVNAPRDYNYYVFELGMSKPGEMSYISKILSPHIAIILNVQAVHLESFNNLNEIAAAKLEIVNGMVDSGTLILDNNIRRALQYLPTFNQTISIKYFNDEDTCIINNIVQEHCHNIAYIKLRKEILLQKFSKDLASHLICNAQSLILCLETLNLDVNKSRKIISHFKPIHGRGEVNYLKNNIILIDESYNSSPVALQKAIYSLKKYQDENNRRIIAVLGDMLELGQEARLFHQRININGLDKLFCLGHLSKTFFNKAVNTQKGIYAHDIKEFIPLFMPCIKKNDVILVKGSNSVKLCKLVEKIKTTYG